MKNAIDIVRNKIDKSITLSKEGYKYSLIWLHGLGDTPQGFFDFFQLEHSPVHYGARIRLLQAPIRKVTANGGMPFTSWYDIKKFDFQGSPSEIFSIQQMKDSLNIINKQVQSQAKHWIQKNVKQNPYQNIFIGGFSQGCTMALLYALTSNNLLAGAIGLSGHPVQGFQLKNLGKIPLLIYHGEQDSLLRCKPIIKLYKQLKFHQYQNIKINTIQYLDHGVDLNQLQDLTKWIFNINKNKQQHLQ